MLNEKRLARLKNHDRRTTIKDSTQAAEQNVKQGVVVDGSNIVWELLREAATISYIAHSAPPSLALAAKSALPAGEVRLKYLRHSL